MFGGSSAEPPVPPRPDRQAIRANVYYLVDHHEKR